MASINYNHVERIELSFVEIRVLIDYYQSKLESDERRLKQIESSGYDRDLKDAQRKFVDDEINECTIRIGELQRIREDMMGLEYHNTDE